MEQSPSTGQLEIEEVLSDKSAFDLFAIHLVGEFSIENLAFLLEAMQIKQDLIDNKLCSQNEVGLMVPMAPERMERTRRRKKSEGYTMLDLRENIKCLMEHYVHHSAPCVVNVSARTRNDVVEVFSELEHKCENQKVVETTSGGEEVGVWNFLESDGSNNVRVVKRNLEFFVNHTPNEPSQLDKELSVQYALLLDNALEEIICLLRSDCLVRFKRSKAYSKLDRDAYASCSSL